jgi:hypothetical protein
MSLEAGEQASSIIRNGVVHESTVLGRYAPLLARPRRKRSLISLLLLAGRWPERRGTPAMGRTIRWIETLSQEAMLLE